MSLSTKVTHRKAGEIGIVNTMAPAILEMWDTRPELQAARSRHGWLKSYTEYCVGHDRIEVVVSVHGEVLAVALLQAVEDVHVGPMLDVINTYIIPDCRGTDITRQLLRPIHDVAISLGLPFVATTRYRGKGRYEVKYTQIHQDSEMGGYA